MCVIYDGEWVGVAKPLTCSVCVFSLEWLTPFYYDDVYGIYYRLEAEMFKHFFFSQQAVSKFHCDKQTRFLYLMEK